MSGAIRTFFAEVIMGKRASNMTRFLGWVKCIVRVSRGCHICESYSLVGARPPPRRTYLASIIEQNASHSFSVQKFVDLRIPFSFLSTGFTLLQSHRREI